MESEEIMENNKFADRIRRRIRTFKVAITWHPRARLTLDELMMIPPVEGDLEDILASSKNTPKDIEACLQYRKAIICSLGESIITRDSMEWATGQDKKQYQQELAWLRDLYWDAFNIRCRALVPEAYFDALLPQVGELMIVLKQRKKIKPNKMLSGRASK